MRSSARSETPSSTIAVRTDELALSPTVVDRFRFYPAVFGPWLLLYGVVQVLVDPGTAAVSFLPFEKRIPVIEWSAVVYASLYPLVLAAPFLARDRISLRRLSLRGWAASSVFFAFYLVFPIVAPPRPFVPTNWAGRLLAFEHGIDTSACALPSFHVIWAFLAASTCADRWPFLRFAFFSWAFLIAVSCITTSAHSLLDVFTSLVFLPLLFQVGRAER